MGTVSKLKSNRTGEEYSVELFEKNGAIIVRHTSLEGIYWNLPDNVRPSVSYEPWNMQNVPGVYAVLVKMSLGDIAIQQIGEFTYDEWNKSNQIARNFPLTTCTNRAFDRAFIRFMQFDIAAFDIPALYSTEEIPLDGNYSVYRLTERKVSSISDNAKSSSTGGAMPDTMPEDIYTRQASHTMNQGMMGGQTQQSGYPGATAPVQRGQSVGHSMQPVPGYSGNASSMGRNVAQQQKRKLSIYRVYHDMNIGKTMIETDGGTLYFNPFEKKWESSTVDLNKVDLVHLYRAASDCVKMPLERFNGPSL